MTRGEKSQGAAESEDEKRSEDEEERISVASLSDEVADVVKEEKGGCFVSLSPSVYDMSRKGEHIKCMTHKCVCLCAPPTPCREGCIHCCRRDKKKAISCFTWCGYPISYTKTCG